MSFPFSSPDCMIRPEESRWKSQRVTPLRRQSERLRWNGLAKLPWLRLVEQADYGEGSDQKNEVYPERLLEPQGRIR